MLAVAESMNAPSVDFLEKIDAQHREQNGKTVNQRQNRQFVLQGHDAQVSEKEEQENAIKGTMNGVKIVETTRAVMNKVPLRSVLLRGDGSW